MSHTHTKMATPYATDDSGKFIAATQRPDGTWRKPRRVKDGYVPQEEVPVYENKFVKFFKTKPDLPPGMSAPEAAPSNKQQSVPGCAASETTNLSKTAKRNMKRKEKRKQQQQPTDDDDTELEPARSAVEGMSLSELPATEPIAATGPAADEPSAASEKVKKIKNLKKKLRQIEELQQKLDSGEIKEPSKDQLEKVGRAQALQEELEQLEEDS